MSDYAKQFLRDILERDPKKRLKLEKIMSHPFMTTFTIPEIVENTFESSHPSI